MGRNSGSGGGRSGGGESQSKADQDNHSNQLNPNNDAYYQSQGYEGRPDDWDQDDD